MSTVVVLVLVEMEESCPPAVEQTCGQVDDHDANHRFRALLDALGQVLVEDHDRQSEDEGRDPVTEPPGKAHARGGATGPLAARRDQRRHGGEMIGVCGVTQTEEHRDEHHDPKRRSV